MKRGANIGKLASGDGPAPNPNSELPIGSVLIRLKTLYSSHVDGFYYYYSISLIVGI